MNAGEFVYKVIRPGEEERGFRTSREAVEYLVLNPGFAELHGPDGLIMTQGACPFRPLLSRAG